MNEERKHLSLARLNLPIRRMAFAWKAVEGYRTPGRSATFPPTLERRASVLDCASPLALFGCAFLVSNANRTLLSLVTSTPAIE